jgi:hypothetical protein
MVVISSAIALKRKESRYFLTVMCYFLTVMRYLLKVSRYLSKVNRYLSKVNHYLSKVNRYFLKVGRCNQWNDEHEVRFLLDQTLSWIFIVLAHWNNSPRVDMSLQSDTLLFALTHWYCVLRGDVSYIYQLHSLWFDPIGTRINDILHSRRGH